MPIAEIKGQQLRLRAIDAGVTMDPELFRPKSFRTQKLGTGRLQRVTAILISTGEWQIQSWRLNLSEYTRSSATAELSKMYAKGTISKKQYNAAFSLVVNYYVPSQKASAVKSKLPAGQAKPRVYVSRGIMYVTVRSAREDQLKHFERTCAKVNRIYVTSSKGRETTVEWRFHLAAFADLKDFVRVINKISIIDSRKKQAVSFADEYFKGMR